MKYLTQSPTKFEAGTMQTAEVVAFAKSIKFIQDLGIKNIEDYESKYLNMVWKN